MEKKAEQLRIQEGFGEDQRREESTSNKDNLKNKELFKRKMLTNNGIMVVGNDERGYFAGIGNSRISEVYETYQEVEELVEKKDWEIIGAYVAVMIEGYMKIKEEQGPIEGKYVIGTEEFKSDGVKANITEDGGRFKME